MFVQSERFIEAHGGRRGAVSVYGQELNDTTRRLCLMNLALRGIEADVALGDTFHDDRHTDLKAHYVLANPPFNVGAQLVARRPPAETSATARPPGVSDVSDVSDVFPGRDTPLVRAPRTPFPERHTPGSSSGAKTGRDRRQETLVRRCARRRYPGMVAISQVISIRLPSGSQK
jgi:hypothetical protein